MTEASQNRQQLVQATAETLRQRIFSRAPGERIGTLNELARDFDVGIVTIQQVARILEHEGLLDVRRGPGGGYFGRRPDVDTLEGLLAAYMRSQPSSRAEALDMTSLLFIELCVAAASADMSEDHRAELTNLTGQIDGCDPERDLSRLEASFQNLLFRIVNRPLFELITRVTLNLSLTDPTDAVVRGVIPPTEWRAGRLRIIGAIVSADIPLARFEADRSNRQIILASLGRV